MTVPSQLIRKLGKSELYLNSLIRRGLYSNFAINLHFKDDINTSIMKKTVGLILDNNQVTNVKIVNGGIYPNNLTPDDVIQDDRSTSLSRTQYISKFITPHQFHHGNSLIRFFLNSKKSLFIDFDHTLSDGISAVHLTRDFTGIYKELLEGKQPKIEKIQLPGPKEELVDLEGPPTKKYSEVEADVWDSSVGMESFYNAHYHVFKKVPSNPIRKKLKGERISFMVFMQHAWLRAFLNVTGHDPEKENAFEYLYGANCRDYFKDHVHFGWNAAIVFSKISNHGATKDNLKHESKELKEKLITGDVYRHFQTSFANPPTDTEELNPWDSVIDQSEVSLRYKNRGWSLFTQLGKYEDKTGLLENIDIIQTPFNIRLLFGCNVLEFNGNFSFNLTMVENDKISNQKFEEIADEFVRLISDQDWLE